MGNREEQAPYIGLLIGDHRITHANLRANDGVLGNSDYNEAGVRPGIPEFDQDEVAAVSTTAGDHSPSLSLDTLGTQDDSKSYHVKTLKGGMPGNDATVVRRDALSGTIWRGWNTHNVPGILLSDYLMDGDSGPAVTYASTTTQDNQALFVWWDNGVIKARKYNPETKTAATAVNVVDQAAAINDDGGIYAYISDANVLDVLTLPSGRVVTYFLTTEVDSLVTSAQLWAAYSDDDGATWRTAQYLGLDGVIDLTGRTINKLRAAYSQENVLLFIEKSWDDQPVVYGVLQYASDDTGLNFTLITDEEAEGSTGNNAHHEIVVDKATGAFVVIWEQTLNSFLRFSRLASPFTPYETADVGIMVSGVSPTHVSAYSGSNGWLYATYDTSDGIDMYYSRDGGVTWVQVEQPFNWNSTTEAFGWDITEAAGKAVWILTQTFSTSGSLPLTDHKMFIMESGGWNTLCQPRVLGQDPTVNRGFGSTTSPEAGTWLFTEKPEYFGWTLVGPTVTPSGTTPLGLNITSTTHYTVAPAGTSTGGMEVFFGLSLDSAGSTSALNVGMKLVLDTFSVDIRFSSTAVDLYDNHAAASVGSSSISGGMATENVFKVALRKSAVSATSCSVTLYRRARTSDVWTALVTTSSLTAGGAGANLIDWGNHVASEDSTWTFFHWVMDPGNGQQGQYFDDLSQNTLDQDPYVLYGAPLPAPPYKLYMDEGLFIRGTSGPATRGDTWKIEPRFDHPVADIDPINSATPSQGLRTKDNTTQTIAWDMTLDTTLGNSSIGMFLGGINFPSAELLGWNGAAWVTLANLQSDLGPGLPCVVTGDTIEVDTAVSVDARYIRYGEFVGGYVLFNGGDIRKIVWNSEGTYTDQVTKRPSFRFEGTAPAGATATCEFWHPSALVLLHENATLYDRYALRIPSQSTAEGYFKVGVCLIGHVAFFGRKYARGRVIETTPNYSLQQDQAGRRKGRKLGQTRRSVTMTWLGTDLTAISGSSPNPNYISMRSHAAAPPVADRYGAPLLVEALLEQQGGAARTCVYIPNIPATTSGNLQTNLASKEGYIYGRIVDAVSRPALLGTENESELVTMQGLKIEEEV